MPTAHLWDRVIASSSWRCIDMLLPHLKACHRGLVWKAQVREELEGLCDRIRKRWLQRSSANVHSQWIGSVGERLEKLRQAKELFEHRLSSELDKVDGGVGGSSSVLLARGYEKRLRQIESLERDMEDVLSASRADASPSFPSAAPSSTPSVDLSALGDAAAPPPPAPGSASERIAERRRKAGRRPMVPGAGRRRADEAGEGRPSGEVDGDMAALVAAAFPASEAPAAAAGGVAGPAGAAGGKGGGGSGEEEEEEQRRQLEIFDRVLAMVLSRAPETSEDEAEHTKWMAETHMALRAAWQQEMHRAPATR